MAAYDHLSALPINPVAPNSNDAFVVHTADAHGSKAHNQCVPTYEAYGACQHAFNYFNQHLFGGALPNPLFTLYNSGKGVRGRYCSRCYVHLNDRSRRTDEILLNPAHFLTRSVADVLSTIGHEMHHMEQQHFGRPSRWGYHNTEWADKMEARGLCPSNTGAPGGARIGRQMTHYIIPGGAFDRYTQRLLADGFTMSWGYEIADQRPTIDPKAGPVSSVRCGATPTLSGKRVKYSCSTCDANAWAKPALPLICGRCTKTMLPGALK